MYFYISPCERIHTQLVWVFFSLLFTFPDNWGIDVVKSRRIFEQNWLGLFEFRIKKLAEKQTSNTESESFTALVSHFQRECLTRWKPNLLVILEKLCDVAIFSIPFRRNWKVQKVNFWSCVDTYNMASKRYRSFAVLSVFICILSKTHQP